MNISEFDYEIPEDQIAQHPLKKRDASKLFIIHKESGRFEHMLFRNIIAYLHPGDVLILNDTKVIPVRLPGKKPTGGKAEITLLRERAKNSWEGLVKGVHKGKVLLGQGITAHVSRLNGTLARVDFDLHPGLHQKGKTDIKEFLNDIGVMPLPVYIKRDAAKPDEEQYQTVFARKQGAVAAPTAGLHFTDSLIHAIQEKGTDLQTITLHVGYGTFRSVKVEDIREHRMDEEYFEISEKTADAVNAARAEGRRIIAVGTTVTRALESAALPFQEGWGIKSGAGTASAFIYPGYSFNIINTLVTNFHLPRSTPMMLASAFSGLALLKKAYRTAQQKGYRFYSYGDAMLII